MSTPELVSEHNHQYFVDLARSAPKIPLDDPRVEEYLRCLKEMDSDSDSGVHFQFGNNFYLLFASMSQSASNQVIITNYLARAEGLDPFRIFVERNRELIDQLIEKIENAIHIMN